VLLVANNIVLFKLYFITKRPEIAIIYELDPLTSLPAALQGRTKKKIPFSAISLAKTFKILWLSSIAIWWLVV